MNILHKSSSFETYSYFIIYPVLIGVCIFFIVGIVTSGNFSLFTVIFLVFFIVFFIISFDSLFRLRYIEVTDGGIFIKTIKGKKLVEYKDIECVYNLLNINGTSLILKYRDATTGKLHVILVRPEEKAPTPKVGFPVYDYRSIELNITKFIKDKAINSNPNYSQVCSHRWFLPGLN